MIKIAKRLLFYIGGILLLAIGINISKTAGLGISPVSAVPYALELIWGFELGRATIFIQVSFMALQILLLRKNYKLVQLLQIACVYFLSFFITYTSTDYLLFWLPTPSLYILRLGYLAISTVIIGIGIAFYLISDFVPLPVEGAMKAIVQVSKDKFKFADVKVAVDVSLVLTSALLSLVFLGKLVTVREGTLLAALFVGKVVGYVFKHYGERISTWFEKGAERNKA